MNIEAIRTELQSRMEVNIERLHTLENSNLMTGSHYKSFKEDLYKTIFELIDKHKLDFKNHEESKLFVDELKPTCESLLTKYFVS